MVITSVIGVKLGISLWRKTLFYRVSSVFSDNGHSFEITHRVEMVCVEP